MGNELPSQKEIQAAAQAIAKTVGKRTAVWEHDYKCARAALEAAEKVRQIKRSPAYEPTIPRPKDF